MDITEEEDIGKGSNIGSKNEPEEDIEKGSNIGIKNEPVHNTEPVPDGDMIFGRKYLASVPKRKVTCLRYLTLILFIVKFCVNDLHQIS